MMWGIFLGGTTLLAWKKGHESFLSHKMLEISMVMIVPMVERHVSENS